MVQKTKKTSKDLLRRTHKHWIAMTKTKKKILLMQMRIPTVTDLQMKDPEREMTTPRETMVKILLMRMKIPTVTDLQTKDPEREITTPRETAVKILLFLSVLS